MKCKARRLCSVLISLVMILGMLPYGQIAMAATYKGFKADDGNGNGILEGYMSLVDNDMSFKVVLRKKDDASRRKSSLLVGGFSCRKCNKRKWIQSYYGK